MAGKGKGKRIGNDQSKIDRRISTLKYTILCFNIIAFAIALSIFALTIWLLVDADFKKWIEDMAIEEYYIGIYILLIASILIVIMSIIGCLGLFSERRLFIWVFIGVQVLCFVLQVVGSAVLLNYGTRNSAIQPLMRSSVRRLIMETDNPQSVDKLRDIQESIGCCGADGPNDYIHLKKPLPSECRDTVTGSAYFYGCVDTFTIVLEDKSAWLAGLALTVCLIEVINVVLAIIIIKLFKKEEDQTKPPHERQALRGGNY